ncbi:hypothetical protein [Iodobacter ciconiae]|uniref:Uncharacterized protein n=1 Tax=Iodobacter ciconiae TaxID=2496266 RepID=A0A3S8ZPF0_9NEIS|nr:hypothetical protein [Iodobacter ciconiae]AZN35342.1 hypothetical protein EJO50_01850 [Iodobacter ciconiae]
MFMSFSTYASECESIPAFVMIYGWIGELPKKAELKIYKDDGKFIDKKNSLIENNNIRNYQYKPEYPPTLEIDFSELKSTRLPVDANFILVLDNKIEYRFSEIDPPLKRLGCRLRGKVNACSFQGGSPVLSAEFKCGNKITKKE